jgi:hypothetical protein
MKHVITYPVSYFVSTRPAQFCYVASQLPTRDVRHFWDTKVKVTSCRVRKMGLNHELEEDWKKAR